MKLFRKLLFLIILILIVLGVIGFTYYSMALKEKPLLIRTSEVTKSEHYVPFNKFFTL